MPQILACPTCKGTISSNATTCPHCGETEFYRLSYSTQYVKCNHCNGSGLVFRTVYDSGGREGIWVAPTTSWIGPSGGLTFFYADDSNGNRCKIGIPHDHPQHDTILKSLKEGNFVLERQNNFYSLRYDPQYCPECNGYGECKIKVVTGKTDLRKKL